MSVDRTQKQSIQQKKIESKLNIDRSILLGGSKNVIYNKVMQCRVLKVQIKMFSGKLTGVPSDCNAEATDLKVEFLILSELAGIFGKGFDNSALV